jgi:alpha-L-fucosidase
VGRNSLLLLNIPPNNQGLIEAADIQAIDSFRTILNQTFAVNLLQGSIPSQLIDNNLSSFAALTENRPLEFELKSMVTFDRLLLQENILNGQSIKSGLLEGWDGTDWKTIASFSTVGYKRLLRFLPVTYKKLRITITDTKNNGQVELAEIGLFKSAEGE